MTPAQPPASPLRRLTGDALVYGIGGSANRLVSVLFVPVFTRLFSPSDYGVLDLLITLGSLLTLLSMVGTSSAVFYYYHRTTDHYERGRMVGTAILMAVGGALVIALLGTLFIDQLAPLFSADRGYRLALALTFVLLPANLLASMVLDLLRLEFRPRAFIALGLARTLLSTSLGVFLVVTTPLGIAGLIGAQAILATVAAAVGLWLTRGIWRIGMDGSAASRVLRFGLPLVPTGLSYWVLQYVDRYFILAYRGADELGIYAVAIRLSGLLLLLTIAFQSAWLPFAYAHAGERGDRELFARVFRIASTGLLAATLLVALFAREALVVLTTPSFVPAYAYVGLLGLALVVHSSYQVISIGVQLGGRTSSMAWTSGAAAVVNLLLNFFLIPSFGLWGASVATVVAYLISTCLLYLVAQRHFTIPYKPLQPILIGAGVIILAAAGLLLDQLAPPAHISPPITLAKVGLALLGPLLMAGYLRITVQRVRQTIGILLQPISSHR